MKIRRRDKIAALGMGTLLAILCPCRTWAFEPWSNVNGYWISADGKAVVKGALAKGVTISKYQNRAGDINWKQLAKSDVSFVMVRLGYYKDMDPYFKENMSNAESVGLDTGICFYGNATDVKGAEQEARYVLDIVKDYRVSYPIAYDVESQELLNRGATKSQITDQVQAFCKVIEDAGYKAAVLGNSEWLTQHMETKRISYDIWYSRYGMAHTFENRTLWRCTDSGSVPGITGSVCLEFAFEDYRETYPGTGWRTVNGKRYYYKDYRMVKSMTLWIEDQRYLFDEKGNSQTIR